MKVRPHALTIAFYLASALWFTAIRYGSQSFYGWLIAPVVQTMLGIGILGLFCAAMLLAGWRGLRTHSIPWVDAAIAGCSLVGLDLFWRFYLSVSYWETFKLMSIALDMATPPIACLGVAALIIEFRSIPPLATS